MAIVLPLAPFQQTCPTDPWVAEGVLRAGIRHRMTVLGLGLRAPLSLPLATDTLSPAPGRTCQWPLGGRTWSPPTPRPPCPLWSIVCGLRVHTGQGVLQTAHSPTRIRWRAGTPRVQSAGLRLGSRFLAARLHEQEPWQPRFFSGGGGLDVMVFTG